MAEEQQTSADDQAPRPRRLRRRWLAALIAVAVIAVGCLAVLIARSAGQPKSAGNAVIYFASELGQERYAEAYDRLCPDIRGRVSEDSFASSSGEVVSPMLTSRGWLLTRRDPIPDIETLDSSLNATTAEVRVQRFSARADGAQPLNPPTETWRVDLVRDGNDWKLCGFTRLA